MLQILSIGVVYLEPRVASSQLSLLRAPCPFPWDSQILALASHAMMSYGLAHGCTRARLFVILLEVQPAGRFLRRTLIGFLRRVGRDGGARPRVGRWGGAPLGSSRTSSLIPGVCSAWLVPSRVKRGGDVRMGPRRSHLRYASWHDDCGLVSTCMAP